jgi:hypothetical protein
MMIKRHLNELSASDLCSKDGDEMTCEMSMDVSDSRGDILVRRNVRFVWEKGDDFVVCSVK